MMDCQLFGLNPGAHHLVNVLLHGTTAILLFLLLRNLTGALWTSGFVAALFAVHPLRVESVAWIAERKDVLSGLFFVLTLAAYVRYARNPSRGSYISVVVLFVLGLLSKPMLVTVPFVLLLLDFWPLARWQARAAGESGTPLKRLITEKIPLLLLSGAACAITLFVQKGVIRDSHRWDFPIRVGNAVVSYAAYLRQTIYPAGLAVLYPHPGKGLSAGVVAASALVLAIMSAAVLVCRRKQPYLLVGWLWFAGMLVPVIGLVQVGIQARADRYTYLPQIGLFIGLGCGAASLCRHWRQGRIALRIAAAAIVVILSVAARVQTSHWRDSISLWTHTLACTSNNPAAHLHLARAFGARGDFAQAMPHYEQALALEPDNVEARVSFGAALFAQRRVSEAIQNYERTLALEPDFPLAHYNLGTALAAQGRLPEAIVHLERAVQLKPDFSEAHLNLGNALELQSRTNEAIQHFEAAVRLKPGVAQNHISLGNALSREKKFTEAITQFEQALRLKPASAETHCAMAAALSAQGKTNEVAEHLQLALTIATSEGNFSLADYIRKQMAPARTIQP